jgi:DNA-binding response OmpR family regulator
MGTILVAEDDAGIRNSLTEALRDEGFAVQTATDGMKALELMERTPPALVLLDLMMPNMTGWQLLGAMANRKELAHVPVFVTTAAQYAGAVPSGYPIFVKPLRLEPLIGSIRTILAK